MSFATATSTEGKAGFARLPAAGFLSGNERANVKFNYFEKLKDPRWQRKRLEVLELGDWACELCGDGESTLHVHHKQYIKGREPWEYEANQLSVLCEACHKQSHNTPDRLIDVVSRLPLDGMKWIDREKAACLLAGLMGLEGFVLSSHEQEAWFFTGLYLQDAVDAEFQRRVTASKAN